jgi:hypothetical protein
VKTPSKKVSECPRVFYKDTSSPPEDIKEYCIMPSGDIVVRLESGESLWFDSRGFHPKTYLCPLPALPKKLSECEHDWTKPHKVVWLCSKCRQMQNYPPDLLQKVSEEKQRHTEIGECTSSCRRVGCPDDPAPPQPKNFDDFFNNAKPEEKKKLLEEVTKEANQDQRDFMNQIPKNSEWEGRFDKNFGAFELDRIGINLSDFDLLKSFISKEIERAKEELLAELEKELEDNYTVLNNGCLVKQDRLKKTGSFVGREETIKSLEDLLASKSNKVKNE